MSVLSTSRVLMKRLKGMKKRGPWVGF